MFTTSARTGTILFYQVTSSLAKGADIVKKRLLNKNEKHNNNAVNGLKAFYILKRTKCSQYEWTNVSKIYMLSDVCSGMIFLWRITV